LNGERLTLEDGEALYACDLLSLGEAAQKLTPRLVPNAVTFVVDRNISYTNVCTIGCDFCAFHCAPGAPGAYVLSQEEILAKVAEKRIATHIAPDGCQPLEVARTKSWGYSVMNLTGLFRLATLAEDGGPDLWNYQTADGRGLRAAITYLTKHMDGATPWPHANLGKWDPSGALALVAAASRVYPADTFPAGLVLKAREKAKADWRAVGTWPWGAHFDSWAHPVFVERVEAEMIADLQKTGASAASRAATCRWNSVPAIRNPDIKDVRRRVTHDGFMSGIRRIIMEKTRRVRNRDRL
jgi:hypothetical protein